MTLARTPLLLAALTALAPACGTYSGTTDTSGLDRRGHWQRLGHPDRRRRRDRHRLRHPGTGQDPGRHRRRGRGRRRHLADLLRQEDRRRELLHLRGRRWPLLRRVSRSTPTPTWSPSSGPAAPCPRSATRISPLYGEFFDASQLTLSTAADLTPGGAGVVPAPSVVTAGEVTTGGAEAEDYEGLPGPDRRRQGHRPGPDVRRVQGRRRPQGRRPLLHPLARPRARRRHHLHRPRRPDDLQLRHKSFAPRNCADFPGLGRLQRPVDPPTPAGPDHPPATSTPPSTRSRWATCRRPTSTSPTSSSPRSFTNSKDNGNFFIAEAGGGEYSGIQLLRLRQRRRRAHGRRQAAQARRQGHGLGPVHRVLHLLRDHPVQGRQPHDLRHRPGARRPPSAEVAAGSAEAENFDCFVEVQNVTVTEPVAMYGEFKGLVVDDLFFLPDPGPNPAMGKVFARSPA